MYLCFVEIYITNIYLWVSGFWGSGLEEKADDINEIFDPELVQFDSGQHVLTEYWLGIPRTTDPWEHTFLYDVTTIFFFFFFFYFQVHNDR